MPTERDVLERLVLRVEPRGDVNQSRQRGDRIRRTRRLVAGSVACLLLLAVGGATAALIGANDENSRQVDIVDAPTTTSVVAEGQGAWTEIEGYPLSPRTYPAVAVSAAEVLIWGGANGERDGAAYSTETGTWRMLAEPPGEALPTLASVLTDRELIVLSGELHGDDRFSAVAYNPATNSWRRLADAPSAPREGVFAAWTGSVAIFYGGVAGDTIPDQTGFLYDPASDEWRMIPESPLGPRAGDAVAWTGSELVVIGGSAQKTSAEPYNPRRDGAAYEPTTNTWRVLPDNPFGDSRGVAYALGQYVVVPDLRCDDECSSAAMLDVVGGSWSDLPRTADVNTVGVSFGDTLLRWGSTEGWAFLATDRDLVQLASLPETLRRMAWRVAVAVDDRIVVVDDTVVWEFRPPLQLIDRWRGARLEDEARRAAEAAAAARAAQARTGESATAEARRAAEAAAIGRTLRVYALDPTPGRFGALPLADEVTFAFGDTIVGSRARDQLADPAQWTFRFPPSTFEGPFSILDALRDATEVEVTTGPQNHCAADPIAPPPGAEGLDQVVMLGYMNLSGDESRSCIEWFAVDLFLHDGKIAVVRYDLWEP